MVPWSNDYGNAEHPASLFGKKSCELKTHSALYKKGSYNTQQLHMGELGELQAEWTKPKKDKYSVISFVWGPYNI